MKKYCFIAAILVSAVACTREPVIPNDPETGKNGNLRYELIAGTPETRTELGLDNGELKPFWSEGDGITIVTIPESTEDFSWYSFEGTLEDDGRIARFSSHNGQFASFVAFYPQQRFDDNDNWEEGPSYIEQNGSQVVVEFRVPTYQYPSPTSFDYRADFMVSNPFEITEENVDFEQEVATVSDLEFTRMNAIVKIVLQDKTSDHKLTGQTVRRVTMSTVNPNYMGGGGELNAPRHTRAEVWNHEDDDEPLENGGLAGWVSYTFPAQEGNDAYYFDNADERYVTAEYTDETYQIGDEGAATYLITVPRILKNEDIWGYDENGDWNPTGEKDGLYIQVETDDFIITRNIDLRDGIALQPSRVTTLNIGLKDESNGTMVQGRRIIFEKDYVTLMPGDDMEMSLRAENVQFPGYYDIENAEDFSSYFSVTAKNEQGEDCSDLVFLEYVTGEQTNYEYSTYIDREYVSGLRLRVDSDVEQEGDYIVTITYDGKLSASCTVHVITSSPSIYFSEDDALLKSICLQYWDKNGDGELSYYEASKVTTLSCPDNGYASPFKGQAITSFDQFQYFTGLTEVYYQAFKNCPLTSIVLPPNVNTIGYEAFSNCSLTSIVFPAATYSISGHAFESCTLLESVVFQGAACYLSESAFENCQKLSSVTIPDDASCSINNRVFYGCHSLQSFTFPTSGSEPLRRIGNYAFACTGLTSIEIPESVWSLGSYAFHYCEDLEEVIFPEGLTEINSYAFWKCWGLHEIVFPSTLNNVYGSSVFYEVTFRSGTDNNGREWKGVTFLGSTPPSFSYSTIYGKHWDATANDGAGDWVDGVTVYVPKGSKTAYEANASVTNNGQNEIVEFD